MNPGPFGSTNGTSTRPYLIRALHDWCTDNGFTPYIAVFVDRSVQVPMEYVKANEIVLNVGFEATSGLTLGNETIEFKARFGGTARDIVVPVDHVIAIYARENGQGMAFPVPTADGGGDVHPVTVPMPGSSPAPAAPRPGAAPADLHLAARDGVSADAPPDASPPDGSGGGGASAPNGSGRPSLKRIK
jgi:stringent starvation protein B